MQPVVTEQPDQPVRLVYREQLNVAGRMRTALHPTASLPWLCVISREFDPDKTGITKGVQTISRLHLGHRSLAAYPVPSHKEDMTGRSPGGQRKLLIPIALLR